MYNLQNELSEYLNEFCVPDNLVELLQIRYFLFYIKFHSTYGFNILFSLARIR